MSNALDMSLDDLIKNNKKSGGGNPRGKGRGASGIGPARRAPNRSSNRPAPYTVGKAPESAWQHDMYSDRMPAYQSPAVRASSIETGSKIYISNLDYGVSNEDIKELFSEFGDLKHFSVHYDRSGRSKGTAEVVFARKVDALAAVKRYNDVQLDGKPMKIEIVGTNVEKPAVITRISGGGFGNLNRAPRSASERVGSRAGPSRSGRRRRGGGGGGSGSGGGGGRGKGRAEVSASDLDADLEKYHSESMQTS
ncbi:Polyadenylate-binding protein RBP45A [Platanthera zijinensis]|uniref:Polyadenylate-binding protein RBP45A n=1 Tax=Platanthera zijinensis TaxID=2320716 RepID=A0AAP0B3V2_9ASPA